MYNDSLILTDGSSPVEAAARCGRTLAEVVGVTIHIMSVVDVRYHRGEFVDIDRPVREQRSALEDRAQDAIDSITVV